MPDTDNETREVDLDRLASAGDDVVVVDVREHQEYVQEYVQGHVPGEPYSCRWGSCRVGWPSWTAARPSTSSALLVPALRP